MQKFDYLIIGGGVAGTTAANTIRQNDKNATIAIVSDELHYLYSRIMLSKPNFFLGKIPFDAIWLKKESWYEKNSIAFIGGKKAVHLNPEEKTIDLDDNSSLEYKKLLLATGLSARPLPSPGADKKGVHYLRTLDHGKSIIEAIDSVKKAVTVGGGFISFEMSNLLRLADIEVTSIIRESRFWESALDEKASHIVEKAMEKSDVKIIREAEIKEITGNDHVTGVILNNDENIPCEMVICGIGAICEIDWLKDSGLNMNRAILANKHLKTNLPDVWAAGDSTAIEDPILQEVVHLGNWVNAQEQGRIAALNMLGEKQPFTFVSYYTTHGFDISVTFIGNVRPRREFTTLTRSGPGKDIHAQLIVLDNELVGAVLVNQIQPMKALSYLIENNVDVSEKLDQLADPDFDLNTLIGKNNN